MTEENKTPLGFRTRASTIQQRYQQVKSQLANTHAIWEELGEVIDDYESLVTEQFDETFEDLQKTDVSHPAWNILDQEADHLEIMRTILETQSLVIALAQRLIDTHDRLADVEKDIQEIKGRNHI